AAAPQWAALIAIADQGRASAGAAALDGPKQLLPMIYQMLPSALLHDITSGASAGTPNYAASAGYDLATGRGSPLANQVVSALVDTTWNNFGGNPQHTAVSAVAAQPINSIHWQTSIDLQ